MFLAHGNLSSIMRRSRIPTKRQIPTASPLERPRSPHPLDHSRSQRESIMVLDNAASVSKACSRPFITTQSRLFPPHSSQVPGSPTRAKMAGGCYAPASAEGARSTSTRTAYQHGDAKIPHSGATTGSARPVATNTGCRG